MDILPDCFNNVSSEIGVTLLPQAIIHTVAENGIFHDYYSRLIERGKPKQVALNNAKNKLLHLAMSLVRNDRDYDKNHMTLHTEKVYM